ncbi:MAG TPA: hypothetical protein VH369_20440 [Bryobacteraceae bacterium]
MQTQAHRDASALRWYGALLEDETAVDQLVDNIGNTAAEYAGKARQIGAGNRLPTTDQFQHDGAIHRTHAGGRGRADRQRESGSSLS